MLTRTAWTAEPCNNSPQCGEPKGRYKLSSCQKLQNQRGLSQWLPDWEGRWAWDGGLLADRARRRSHQHSSWSWQSQQREVPSSSRWPYRWLEISGCLAGDGWRCLPNCPTIKQLVTPYFLTGWAFCGWAGSRQSSQKLVNIWWSGGGTPNMSGSNVAS